MVKRVNFIFKYILPHAQKTWRLKATTSYYLCWFCGLTGLSWVVLAQGLSCPVSQMVAGAGITESSVG